MDIGQHEYNGYQIYPNQDTMAGMNKNEHGE